MGVASLNENQLEKISAVIVPLRDTMVEHILSLGIFKERIYESNGYIFFDIIGDDINGNEGLHRIAYDPKTDSISWSKKVKLTPKAEAAIHKAIIKFLGDLEKLPFTISTLEFQIGSRFRKGELEPSANEKDCYDVRLFVASQDLYYGMKGFNDYYKLGK